MKIIPSIWPVPFFVAFFASDLMLYARLAGEAQAFFFWNRGFAYLFPLGLLAVLALARAMVRRALQRRGIDPREAPHGRGAPDDAARAGRPDRAGDPGARGPRADS